MHLLAAVFPQFVAIHQILLTISHSLENSALIQHLSSEKVFQKLLESKTKKTAGG